jgi:hypothetical protein
MIITKKLKIARFSEEGKEKFAEILKNRTLTIFKELEELTNDSLYSTPLGEEVQWKPVSNRREMAEVMWEVFGEGKSLSKDSGDRNIWNWLSAALFETLLSGNTSLALRRENEEIERWVLTESSRSYHRHLVSGPFFVFQNNWPNIQEAMSMLAEPHKPTAGVPAVLIFSEVHERITGKRELASGKLAHLSTLLYVDPFTGRIRDNLTNKPGEPQQLSKFCRQLDLTVDYESMEVKELLNFLPSNFAELVAKVKSEDPKYA